MGKLKMSEQNGFQSLLYVNFIIRKKYRVDEVAQKWVGRNGKKGIHKDTLYKWIRGENHFPPDRIAELVNATGDIEYLEYHCDPCGFTLMPKIKDKHTAKMISHMVRLMQSAIDLKEE